MLADSTWQTPGWAMGVLGVSTLLSLLVAATLAMGRRASRSDERADEARDSELRAELRSVRAVAERTEVAVAHLAEQNTNRFDRVDRELRDMVQRVVRLETHDEIRQRHKGAGVGEGSD
ncbi:MAG: hypothetical protein H6826_14385 [Planctomycetes bacterium]|nr:hypothetical protein [Planctomycetota bacterium]